MIDPEFDRVIPPGKEGKLKATVKTERLSGKVAKSITVTTNDPKKQHVRLMLQAEVKPVIYIKPSEHAAFMRVDYGTSMVKEFTITGEEGRPLEIKNLKSSLDYVKAEIEETGDHGYKLKVTLTKDAPIGIIRTGLVSFETNYKERPRVRLRISGSVEGPIKYPNTIFFFISKEQPESQIRTVTLRASQAEPFKIKGVETDIPQQVSVAWEALEQGKRYVIKLKYIGDKEAATSFAGKLTVKTDNKIQPVIEIPVRGRPQSSRPKRVTVPPVRERKKAPDPSEEVGPMPEGTKSFEEAVEELKKKQ